MATKVSHKLVDLRDMPDFQKTLNRLQTLKDGPWKTHERRAAEEYAGEATEEARAMSRLLVQHNKIEYLGKFTIVRFCGPATQRLLLKGLKVDLMPFLGEGTIDEQSLQVGFLRHLGGDANINVPPSIELYCLWFGESG